MSKWVMGTIITVAVVCFAMIVLYLTTRTKQGGKRSWLRVSKRFDVAAAPQEPVAEHRHSKARFVKHSSEKEESKRDSKRVAISHAKTTYKPVRTIDASHMYYNPIGNRLSRDSKRRLDKYFIDVESRG